MDGFLAARSLIGHSLAFHILIVALSIGLPVLLSLFEWYAWRKNSERLRAFVRLLAKWTAVFVIGGIFTGTIIALQMSTLWAPFMSEVRPTVGQWRILLRDRHRRANISRQSIGDPNTISAR
jgi:cytochrome d ubiquinol oxidase subunit I